MAEDPGVLVWAGVGRAMKGKEGDLDEVFIVGGVGRTTVFQ